jgi:Tol biopolymer transport system component
MTNKAILIACLVLAATFAASSSGQEFAGMTAEIFAPGVVSRGKMQMKLTMSADGSEILYTERDPSTNAMTFISQHREGSSWSEPVVLPYGREYTEIEPSLCPDGKSIVFTSNRPSGGRGEPEELPDIWMAERTGNQWGSPVHLGPPVNTGAADIEAHPFIGPDGALYFMRQVGNARHLFRAARLGGGFDEPRPVPLKDDLFTGQFSGPCLSPDGRILVMHSRKDGGFGTWDLYVSFKDEAGEWCALKNMGPAVNTDKQEGHPSFSPDGRALFFDRDGDIYWISANFLADIRDNAEKPPATGQTKNAIEERGLASRLY